MKLKRGSVATTEGQRLGSGIYILSISSTGRTSAFQLNHEECLAVTKIIAGKTGVAE